MTVVNPRMRRRARERALQYLYGLEFTRYAWDADIAAFWEGYPARPGVKDYAQSLIQGVSERQAELDLHIGRALDNWTPERLGYIERVLLRIALYEMLYMEDVPATVAINEAIEVAKTFGSDETPRFVNGILDRLRRQIQGAAGTK